VSHGKARKETNCLNCNAEVTGRYCSVCGQENIEPKETLWQLLSHFVYDMFHYDGKALSTLKILIFKPGLLTREYIRGKRASYLHPIRLYIFISAAFFIIFLSFIVDKSAQDAAIPQLNAQQHIAIEKSIDKLKDSLAKTNDPAKKADLQQSIISLKKIPSLFSADSAANKQTLTGQLHFSLDTSNHTDNFLAKNLPATLAEYNQQQAKFSPDNKDGWLKRVASTKIIEINEKYRYNENGFINDFSEHFFHLLPTMMFVSLPVVALIFQLLYIRRRKQFTYVQHAVFSIHIYIAAYIFILVYYLFGFLHSATQWNLFGWISVIVVLGIFYYLYRAMRNFYDQGRWKTVLKFFIAVLVYFGVLILLMMIFFMTSLIQI
jgi:hypothetical protein